MSLNYSAIMAAKNASELIVDSLKSIYEQSLPATEVIVVLDGPDLELEEIVRAFNSQITIHVRPSLGQAAALNFGIEAATCEYIAILDADDLWQSEKMARQVAFLEAHPGSHAVCSGVRNFLHGSDPQSAGMEGAKDFNASRLMSATTLRKSAFFEFGLLPTDVSHFEWQYRFWSDASSAGLTCGRIEEIHLLRRVHAENSWVTRKQEGESSLLAFIRAHKEKLADGGD